MDTTTPAFLPPSAPASVAPIAPVNPAQVPQSSPVQQTPVSQPVTNSIDKNAQILALAIAKQEGGGKINYTQIGDDGASSGAYQWNNNGQTLQNGQIPANFQADATKYGLNPNDFSPANQNQVAYMKVKALLDSGLTPPQVASSWNAGEGEPNAYTGQFSNGQASTTKDYDVKGYTKGVLTYASQMWRQQQNQSSTPVTPTSQTQSVPATQTNPNQLPSADGSGLPSFIPGQQIGRSIGTLAGYIGAKIHDALSGTHYADYYDLSAPTPLQTIGDSAKVALTIAGGMPEGAAIDAFGSTVPAALPEATSLFGRIAGNAALGAGFGAAGALSDGSTNIGDIAKQTGTSAIIGGLLGLGTGVISKAFESLPPSIAQLALKLKDNPESIQQALDDLPYGLKSKMAAASQDAANIYNENIDGILSTPEYAKTIMNGQEAAKIVTEQFGDSNLTVNQVGKYIKQVAPQAAGLYDRFVSDGLSMEDTNRLRSLIDEGTRSVYHSDAIPTFAKQVSKSMADTLRGSIQEGAPETAPFFEKLHREIPITNSLARGGKFGLRRLIELALASGGHIPAALGIEAVNNPGVQLNVAKALQDSKPLLNAGLKAGKLATLNATS